MVKRRKSKRKLVPKPCTLLEKMHQMRDYAYPGEAENEQEDFEEENGEDADLEVEDIDLGDGDNLDEATIPPFDSNREVPT